MRKRRFTPGPWQVGPRCESIRPTSPKVGLPSINGGCVICIPTGGDQRENAALMAAAPELFDMLEDLAEQHKCDCGHPACKRCDDYRRASEILDRAADLP